jgi:HK97 family phage portal protein
MYTRTGDRPIRVNDPDGWMTEPAIPQPSSGGINPGFHWLGSDNPSWFASPTVGGGLPSVYRALGIIVDSLSSVPWAVYRGRERLPEPGWIADPQMAQDDNRAPDMSRELAAAIPDPLHSVAFRAQLVSSLVMHGEAFIYHPAMDFEGRYPVAPVFLLNPLDLGWDKFRNRWKVGQTFIEPRKILHVRGRAPYTDEGRGVGVLTRHADSIRLAVNLRNYVSSSLKSGVPAGYLKVSSPSFTQEQADGLKLAWMAAHGGDTRSIAVLNATTDFSPLSWSLSDVAAVEMGAFSDREIAHAFGMSAHYLDVPGGSETYANVQDRVIDLRTFTLLPPARLIESAMESRLPYGTTMKIKLEGLERANITTRDASYKAGLAGGYRTVDEIRELEDLPSLAEGNQP